MTDTDKKKRVIKQVGLFLIKSIRVNILLHGFIFYFAIG